MLMVCVCVCVCDRFVLWPFQWYRSNFWNTSVLRDCPVCGESCREFQFYFLNTNTEDFFCSLSYKKKKKD